MDVNKVMEAIARIESDLAFVKSQIARNPRVNISVNNADVRVKVGDEVVQAVRPVPVPDETFDIYQHLHSPEWPEAVPADLLCEPTDEDKMARAEMILDMTIDRDIEDLRFLDYGCGDGYMAKFALDRGVVMSTGYDIHQEPKWDELANHRLRYTGDRRDLERGGYDVILLYDVLDHCHDPTDILHHVSTLLAPGGTVYAACHPWTSRHGGHLYRQVNRAYAHLIGGVARDHDAEYVHPVRQPCKTYRRWFVTAGFKVRDEDVRTEPLEPYFRRDPRIWRELTAVFDGLNLSDDEMQRVLEIEFVNYVLGKEGIY